MSNSINSLSPSFRDYLLLKNLVTDTVVDNGLEALLNGIGLPTQIETPPNAVQPSNSINLTGVFYQESNTILNQYQGNPNDYTQVNIVYNQSNSNITNQGPYSNSNKLLGSSEDYRDSNTIKNAYIDKDKQDTINLNTQPVPVFQSLTSYIDENNNLAIGGPSTQAADIIAGVVGGQGVGFDVTSGSLIANEDIRSTLLGRVLGATGVINDTPLGNIGGQQLLAHVGYNAAFGLQQETLDSLNLNPLSLLQGKPLVTLNYSITVPKNTVGKVLNFAANIFGVQSPLSLLQDSIFSFDNKGKYIFISNIEMTNNMIKNTGMGQVQSLFNNLRANTNIDRSIEGGTLRQGYNPGYKDDRISKGQNTGDGLNSKLYARDNGDGSLIDFISGKANNPISSGNYERSKQISDDGWSKDYFDKTHRTRKGITYENAYGWQNKESINKDGNESIGSETLFTSPTEKDKKTLLYKTQKLFDSGNMRTIISGHGDAFNEKSQINSSVSRVGVGGYTPKGSGVLSRNAVVNDGNNGPENVFCRTWTTYDRYSQVIDLQKNSGLYGTDPNKKVFRQNGELSVLEDNGFVRVAPYKTDKMSSISGDKYSKETDNKRYMFSIENLAWNDNLVNLLPCEIGPGDSLSGRRGRIMWFPPYDITFNETTSASWDKHNFIGRGEPIYTYNNTERTGTLSWKIIIDHPNYLNFMSTSEGITLSNYDEFVASFFAGCIPYENINSFLTIEEKDKTEVKNKKKEDIEVLPNNDIPPDSFNVYFPNDVYDVDKYPTYEDGKIKDCNEGGNTVTFVYDNDCNINKENSPDGKGNGLGTYTEMCYQFESGGKIVWSSEQCTKSNGPKGGDGRLEPDRTNYGLNAEPVKLGDKTYKNWRDPEYHKDLQQWLLTKCKSCKVEVVGFASTVGTFGTNRNDKLSELRANNVRDWLLNNVLTTPPFDDKVFIKPEGKGATETESAKCNAPNAQERKKDYLKSKNDEFGCKANRYVTVKFTVDANLKTEEKPKLENEIDKAEPENIIIPKISPGRFYSECDYFEKLAQTSPTVYDTISEKIKYFQPSFHSTTPEGFNSRLTFLQQCMRQGPTKGAGSDNNPNNLAFGAPPVCILRIGDFYHTKIVIENLSFGFEPLVWDLNPEGVGVQPMICNVDMSFNFIGGSSLQGPINKLQNAVSFNYFANTEIYDLRSDTIVIKDGDGKIVNGVTSFITEYDVTDAETQGKGKELVKNQEAQNNNANAGDQPLVIVSGETSGSTSGSTMLTDADIFKNAKDKNTFQLNIELKNDKLSGTFSITGGLLSKPYDVKLRLLDSNTLDVVAFKISASLITTDTNFGGFESNGWELILSEISKSGTKPLNFVIEVPEFKSIKYYSIKNLSEIKK
jgi:hypothetical protein